MIFEYIQSISLAPTFLSSFRSLSLSLYSSQSLVLSPTPFSLSFVRQIDPTADYTFAATPPSTHPHTHTLTLTLTLRYMLQIA